MPLDPYDYQRIQIQMDFQCPRGGTCCQVADPIDICPKDIRRLPSFFNNSNEEAIEEYTIPPKLDYRAWRSTRIAPPQIKVIKELKGIWKSFSNPNSRTKKKLEKALAKMMQIEMTDHSQFQN